MPKTDQEVFEHFRSFGSDPGEEIICLLAYASYAQAKYEWVNHSKIRHGRDPTEHEVATWIADLPNPRLADILNSAIDTFNNAAERYLKTRTEEERAKAVDSSILGRVDIMAQRVERATSFRATFLPNLFTGVVASFAFALLIILASLIFNKDPSPFAFFKNPAPAASGPAPGH
jgi:hypothetical protein